MAKVVTVAVVAMLVVSARGDGTCTLSQGNDTATPPNFLPILNSSYSLTVEMKSLTEDTTTYVTEVHERRQYFNQDTNTVGVSVEHNGTSDVYQYYPTKDVFVREQNGTCGEMETRPASPWGWYDPDPQHGDKSFGPSTILRLANLLKTEYIGHLPASDGVDVNEWKACAEDGGVELGFRYSNPPWSMPDGSWFNGIEASLPVTMEVKFMDGSQHWVYSFVEILPYAEHHHLLEPPRGMGCEAIAGVLSDAKVPTIPKHFSLAEEVIIGSEIDGVEFGKQHVDKLQFTYAGEISLDSLLYTPPDYENTTAYSVKVIHDYNTDVQYAIFTEYGNCSRERIPPFTFDEHFGGFLGSGDTLLSPNGLFHLDKLFAFVGERGSRDIEGNLWTSTRSDIPDPSTGGFQNYEKAVLEYYFSQDIERSPSGGFVENELPFRGDLFIYDSADKTKIISQDTSNFYDFRVLDMFSPDEFSIQECYEKHDDDWSFIMIFFPIEKSNQVIAANEEPTRFKHEVMSKLITIGRVSPVRIASIDISTGVSGLVPNSTDADVIIAQIKILERAPYIYQYREPNDEPDPKPGANNPIYQGIRYREDCAEVCSKSTNYTCKAFYSCGSDCYLSDKNEPEGKPLQIDGGCSHYVYDMVNKTVVDDDTNTAYTSIFAAIRKGDFNFLVPYRNNSHGASFTAKMSMLYRTPDPFDPVRMQFSLDNRLYTVTNYNDSIKDIDDAAECMLLCVGWIRYQCETIIHQRDEKLCLLLDRHYEDIDETEFVPHSHSYIYGRSYLVEYSPILGGVALNTTGPVYYEVKHLEDCARHCNDEPTIQCESFEYCPSNQMCHLHKEHFLDVVNDGNYITGTACIHFSRKTDSEFTKYEDQGLMPSQHRIAEHFSSPSACAKMCMEDEQETCQSFDFCIICDKNTEAVCGSDEIGTVGACYLGLHHLGESGLKLQTAKGCDHYDRNMFGNQDYPSWKSSQRKVEKPYTPGDMTGLAFGMIFLGIILAVGFLVGITMFCKPASMPKDLEVSFQRLQTPGESTI